MPDGGPPGLRRRRQPRSHADGGQGRRQGDPGRSAQPARTFAEAAHALHNGSSWPPAAIWNRPARN